MGAPTFHHLPQMSLVGLKQAGNWISFASFTKETMIFPGTYKILRAAIHRIQGDLERLEQVSENQISTGQMQSP